MLLQVYQLLCRTIELNPWSWTLLEKPPESLWSWSQRALHWSLPWARSIRSTPLHPLSLTSNFNIIHPHMSWSSWWSLSFWLSHQYPIYIPLLRNSCYVPCQSHPRLNHSNYTWRSSSLCSFLQSPVTSSHFGPNILLSTLFSNTLSPVRSNCLKNSWTSISKDFCFRINSELEQTGNLTRKLKKRRGGGICLIFRFEIHYSFISTHFSFFFSGINVEQNTRK
jgi:hypothetical protein